MKDPRKCVNHLVQVYCKLFSTLCWNNHFHPCSSLWCSWQPFGLGRGDSCEFSAAPLDFGAVNMTDSDWPGINGKLPVFFLMSLDWFSIPYVLSSATLNIFGALFSMWFTKVKLSSLQSQGWRTEPSDCWSFHFGTQESIKCDYGGCKRGYGHQGGRPSLRKCGSLGRHCMGCWKRSVIEAGKLVLALLTPQVLNPNAQSLKPSHRSITSTFSKGISKRDVQKFGKTSRLQ